MQPAQVYSREQYASKQFWQSRYREKPSYFDWYAQFPELQQTLEQQYHLHHGMHILMLGCGNSKLSEQMYEAGYHRIFNVDISEVVIEQMKKVSQERGYTEMRWEVMDATDMKGVADATFDAIIDKGTLDALVSGKNMDICERMLRESMRVLKPDGQFILITYGSPEGRKRLFEASIGLVRYDYWFTKVDLSSMSTLINLMRANLGNQPLSAITKNAEAMSKSLIEFNLLKVLRRNKKNEKKYVLWSEFKHSQAPEPQINPTRTQQSPVQSKPATQQPQPTSQQVQQPPAANKQVTYSPKKQSFCYVYSIQPKFAIDMDQVVGQNPVLEHKVDEHGNIVLEGVEVKASLGFYLEEGHQEKAKKVIGYLQRRPAPDNTVVLYSSPDNLLAGKEALKYTIKQGSRNALPVYAKTVYQFTLPCSDIAAAEKQLRSLCGALVDGAGLEAHPSPRHYAYLGILMQKTNSPGTFTQFLKTRWYPTHRLVSYSPSSAVYQVSVPPTLTHDYCLAQLTRTLHLTQASIARLRCGFINYFEPRLMGLFNLCSWTYSNGENMVLVVEQWLGQHQDEFDSSVPVIYCKSQAMEYVLVRLAHQL